MNPRDLEQIGPYPVVEFVAEGGMAWVFKVLDPRFKVHRALKMLKPQAAQGEEFRRFETEAKLLAQVEHPNLITIYDLGKDEPTGCQYYTMNFVDGPTLAGLERLGPWEAVDIFVDVLSALARLHDQGIIHRDIKPGNILMTADGRALLGDLGIARQQDQLISLTRTGMAIGSVQYMSPEQARGSSVSTASDIFSIGLTLYQVLSGHTIYDVVEEVDATSGEQVLMYLGALIHSGSELSFDFPREVPVPLRRVIEKACRFDPNQRYANAGELRHALLSARVESERGKAGRSRSLVLGLAGFILAALIAGAWWLGRESTPSAEPLAGRYQERVAQIGDPETSVAGKVLIVQEMGADPHPDALKVLIAASEDPSEQVAVDAIKQLQKRVNSTVARHLITLLDSSRFTVRAWAARVLGKSGRAEALEPLQARLEDESNSRVRRELERAIEALGGSPGEA